MATKTPEDIINTNWNWSPNALGQWTNDEIRTAALVYAARELRSIKWALEAINRKLDSLGTDGIHEVIREQRHVAVGLRKKRVQRERKARLKRAETRKTA